MGKLEGKVAIITGGATGIGEATAKLFAQEGAAVVITTSRNWDGLKAVQDEIVANGGKAFAILADAASEADWDKVVEATIEKYGKINLLVNNAGRRPFGGVENTTLEQLEEAFKYDCFSVFLGMNRCIPYMRKVREDGEEAAIVNMSSLTSLAGAPQYIQYIPAKAAVNAMTKCAAADLCGTGIRVNTILPGLIETPLIKDKKKEDQEGFIRQFMIQRKGEADEIAHATLYLCSDEARYVNATELIVDGGFAGTRSYK